MSTHEASGPADPREDGEIFAELLQEPGHDPNFLPIEADNAMRAAAADHEIDAVETLGEPGHDPNFLPIEAGRSRHDNA